MEPAEEEKQRDRPWVRPLVGGVAFLLLAAGTGFGIGYATGSGGSGPDLSEEEAFAEARERTENEVSREMARRGFDAGRRAGRSHGIVAGGMAAESTAAVRVRRQRAAVARSEAATVQGELAELSAGAPPEPQPPAGAGDSSPPDR